MENGWHTVLGNNIEIPNSVFRLEMFKDSEEKWCCSVNYQDVYSRADTAEEAFDKAVQQVGPH